MNVLLKLNKNDDGSVPFLHTAKNKINGELDTLGKIKKIYVKKRLPAYLKHA